MDVIQFRDYCLSMTGAVESFPFDKDTLAFKVKGKIFALTSLKTWETGEGRVNLKCAPEKAEELRLNYPESVLPGYHMNKKHWNSVLMTAEELSEKRKFYLINHSYELVVSKLPKKKRREIRETQQHHE